MAVRVDKSVAAGCSVAAGRVAAPHGLIKLYRQLENQAWNANAKYGQSWRRQLAMGLTPLTLAFFGNGK